MIYKHGVSDEPLEIIRANECDSLEGLATSRFRALWNEIERLRAARPEARTHEAWIVTSDKGKVLHFSRADGWTLDIVQPLMNSGGT